jgi:hypothetical protein
MKKWLQYHLPVALTLFMCVTIKRTVVTDGGYDRLYGLPFPYISNSYVTSMSFDIYILPMILNVLFFLVLTTALFKVFEKTGVRVKAHWIMAILGGIISLFWIVAFIFMTRDSYFYFTNRTEYKPTSKELIFDFNP